MAYTQTFCKSHFNKLTRDENMNWGESIKLLRAKMLLTQAELASKLDVSFASVNRWENGEHEPTMKVKRELMKMFKKYGVVEE